MTDVVIFFALEQELGQAYSYLKKDGGRCDDRYEAGTLKAYHFTFKSQRENDWVVLIHCLGEQGNLDIATSVGSILSRELPPVAIMAGIAGSLDPSEVKIGDVVVACGAKMMTPDGIKTLDQKSETFSDDKSRAHDELIVVDARDRLMKETFLRQRRRWMYLSDSYSAAAGYVNSSKELLKLEPVDAVDSDGNKFENPLPKIVSTTILGSDAVVDSAEYVTLMHERNEDLESDYYKQKGDLEDLKRLSWRKDKLLAVDMESFGFFAALTKSGLPKQYAFAVRGISDHATGKRKLDVGSGEGVRHIAARNAAAVALDLAQYLRRTRLGK